jgi:cation diffusion facilitator CzcD-associated flavoprotein CzcO
LRPVVFDEDDQVGGRWARRYDRLHLHTVRRFSGLAYHPMPRTYPRYVPKDLVARYLQEYAEHFGLDLRLGHRVRRIARSDRGLWDVETSVGPWYSQVVVVATGHYNRPHTPSWPGRDDFAGRVVHSVDYATGSAFAKLRALVVGLGNTGAEIATDLVEQGAAHVAISVRTPPPIMPRDLFGFVPVQLLGLAFAPIPAPRAIDAVGVVLRRVAVGDLSKHGLGKAGWGPFTARRPPVIDVGFLRELKAGRIEVRPALARLTPTGAVFEDGTEEAYDAIIAATGFDTALGELLDLPDAVDEHSLPRSPSGQATAYPGLYFVGFDERPSGHLHRARAESRRVATLIARYLEADAPSNPDVVEA